MANESRIEIQGSAVMVYCIDCGKYSGHLIEFGGAYVAACKICSKIVYNSEKLPKEVEALLGEKPEFFLRGLYRLRRVETSTSPSIH